MLTMYLRSRSPRSSKTSSWIASNSLPSSSICSSVRRASGLSIIVAMRRVLCRSGSQGDLDGALGRVDAGADHLALAQDRLGAVALRLDVAVDEADLAAVAALAVADSVRRLEALHVQEIAVAVGVPVLGHRVEHRFGPAHERLAPGPVGTQLGEAFGRQPPVATGDLQVQAEAGAALRQLAQLVAEDRVVFGARRVQVDDVVELPAAIEVAQHAHDRGDAAAGADEQEALGQRIGQDETALDPAEADDRAGLRVAVEER